MTGMSTRLVIAAIQANPTVGAIAHNEALARERLAQAKAAGADVAVFSELFINGYPPEDLALKPAFWAAGKAAVERLSRIGSEVSLFIDADERQIEASRRVGAPAIELHTGRYADATTPTEVADELQRIVDGVNCGLNEGLIVNAGHGLHYHNVEAVAAIKGINELNIGHALVAHALFVGFKGAVAEMKALILAAAKH